MVILLKQWAACAFDTLMPQHMETAYSKLPTRAIQKYFSQSTLDMKRPTTETIRMYDTCIRRKQVSVVLYDIVCAGSYSLT